MTDITFVTSNKIKLAHARFLCRDYQVRILHYKKLFYGIGYEEPRIKDREQLLSESFNDAVLRWKRNVTIRDNRLFFIEDTSVKIDALSDSNNEVPGVDVKYWMKETSFEDLDKALKKKGNNRRCSVTSHIILYLTEELRKKLGFKEERKVFMSTAYGSVTNKEYCFDSQTLYPWLDNESFNKWFVPEGYNRPVSMLDISEAEAGDFRKGAFDQMIHFLKENGAIDDKPSLGSQLQIHFYTNFIVCGKSCAGKSTIGKYLVNEYGYYHIEASEFMAHRLHETLGTESEIDKHSFAAKVLEVEPLFVVNSVIEFMREHEIYDKFIVTGFRTQKEVDAFNASVFADGLITVFINASYTNRCQRWLLRRREIDKYNQERFKEIDELQERMGINDTSNVNGIQLFDNDIDGLSSFYSSFESRFLSLSKHERITISEKALSSNKVPLESAILIVLALEYRKDESRSFTTTEISHLINALFRVSKRSKNNVSRYFNQAYYVYYEVRYENGKNRYRISPIGYSEAIRIIKKSLLV